MIAECAAEAIFYNELVNLNRHDWQDHSEGRKNTNRPGNEHLKRVDPSRKSLFQFDNMMQPT